MSNEKTPNAWRVEARYPGDEKPVPHYTGNDKAYVLKEVAELIDSGASYINVTALYPLFGSADMREPHDGD